MVAFDRAEASIRIQSPRCQIYLSPPYDHPVQIDVETSQKLWEAISAVYNDDHAILHTVPELHGRVQVRQLMDCA